MKYRGELALTVFLNLLGGLTYAGHYGHFSGDNAGWVFYVLRSTVKVCFFELESKIFNLEENVKRMMTEEQGIFEFGKEDFYNLSKNRSRGGRASERPFRFRVCRTILFACEFSSIGSDSRVCQ